MQIYPPGTRIGQYEIASLPIMGGMGVVYFALDHGNDGRPVALKTFRPELLPNRAARDRFLREGTAWIELGSHPHIVRCYKVEYIDPTAFLVLELIAKEQDMPDASLRSWLITGRPLPLEQALLFASQITRGMQHATEKISGFVHRDLKPENILVGVDRLPNTNINRLRVTDFGLIKTHVGRDILTASSVEELEPDRVQFTQGAGTPLYMAPEQWRGETVGVFTDIYALGCILHEMFTGQLAFSGSNLQTLRLAHCKGQRQTIPKNLPKFLHDLVDRCLKVIPEKRYQNWEEVEIAFCDAWVQLTGQSLPQTNAGGGMQGADLNATGWSYINLGISYADIGKVEIAKHYFDRAYAISQENRESHLENVALGNIGNISLVIGDIRVALEHHQLALDSSQKISETTTENSIEWLQAQKWISADLTNLGHTYQILGDSQSAIGYFEQSLSLSRKINNKRGEASSLNNLGIIYYKMGDSRRSLNFYTQALKIFREIADRRGEGSVLGNIGNVYRILGDLGRATAYFKQALLISQEIGNRSGEGSDLGNLGNISLALGDAQQAILHYEQSLEIQREIGNRRDEGDILGSLGTVYSGLGDVPRAIGYHELALNISRELGNLSGEGINLSNLGTIYQDLGNYQRAIECFEQALYIGQKLGDRRLESIVLGNLGTAFRGLGNTKRAIIFCQKAIEISRELEDLTGIATNSFTISLLYAQNGEFEYALSHAKEAANIWTQIGHVQNVKQAQILVSEIQADMKQVSDNKKLIQATINAFLLVNSEMEMRRLVKQYPIVVDPEFIAILEELITTQTPTKYRPPLQQRLTWLQHIVDK